MFYVPLYIEALRSRPNLLFWAAALAQAIIWLVVPMVFYAAPPGELPQLLAIGHEFQLRGDVGPPLAYWLAEIAFRLAGLSASTRWRRFAWSRPIGACSRWAAPSSARRTPPWRFC